MAKSDAQKNKAYKDLPDGFKALAKDIKNDSLPPVVLICGKEQYLVKWAVNEIVKKNVNEATAALDLVRIDPNHTSVAAITEACETVSLFSSKKVVVIEDFYPAEGRKKQRREKGESAETVDSVVDDNINWDDLASYIPSLTDGTLLVMTCGIPDVTSGIFKAVEGCGATYVLKTLTGSDLRNFIEKRIHSVGKEIKPAVLNELIDLSGYTDKESDYTLYNLENDVMKIIAHAQNDYITSEDVKAGIIGNVEHNIFELLDAISQGRKDEAYRLFFNEMKTQDSVLPLLSQVITQFERILFVREMRDESKNMDEICKQLKQKPGAYPVKKAYGFSEYYSVKQLKNILKGAYDVDARIKTGLLSESLALEMFIAQL